MQHILNQILLQQHIWTVYVKNPLLYLLANLYFPSSNCFWDGPQMFRCAKLFHNQWPLWYQIEWAFSLSYLSSLCQWFCTRHKGSRCRLPKKFTFRNVNFFGQIYRDTWYYAKNPQNMTDYQKITEKKGEWLTQLAGEASTTPKMFLTGDLDLGDNNKLYGSVQCTGDLSSMDCNKCLNESIGFLPKCCDSSKGVRIYSGTCDVRFETIKYFSEWIWNIHGELSSR